jgi:VanZ family protein
MLTLALITLLSLTPLPHLPTAPGSDKVHHLLSYGVLFFPVALAKPKQWRLIGLFFFIWSGVIELVQPYVNRYGELLDMLANGVGLLCGFFIAQLANKAAKNND